MAEIIYSSEHAHQELLAWPRVVCCRDIWAPPKELRHLLLPHSCVCWFNHERREYSVSAATAAESARRESCYGCCASQERINRSVVPTASQVSFHPLSSCLAYSGFSEQCEQWDNWHREQDQQNNTAFSLSDICNVEWDRESGQMGYHVLSVCVQISQCFYYLAHFPLFFSHLESVHIPTELLRFPVEDFFSL